MKNVHIRNKQTALQNLGRVCRASDKELLGAINAAYAKDATLFAFQPVNEASGPEGVLEAFWLPLRNALPDIQRREAICAASEHEGKNFVAMMGHYQGTFRKELFGIPATNGVVHIRYGEIHEVDDGTITCSYVIADLLDLARQAGYWPITPSVGAEGMWPGPAGQDGVSSDTVDPDGGAKSLRVVLDMHKALFDFDGRNIESMDLAKYWTPDFMWYGPSGIGATRGLEGFRAHHQIPFLRAFPDRKGGKHIGKIADGKFVVTGGWPSVVATHTGNDWLGLGPTGKRINMRVMDFYRLEDGLIDENWVPIDIVDILKQMGVDVLDRIRHISGKPRMKL
jgi:predicted ester cyclase